MSARLQSAMRAQAAQHGNLTSHARFGTVTGYDPGHYSVKVLLKPENAETGWLPLLAPWVGNNFGLVTGPQQGDQIMVVFQEGRPEAGVAMGRAFSALAQPPAVPSGECWIVHGSGAFVKLTNDGKVTVHDSAGSSAVLNADGTATISAASGLTVNAASGVTINAASGGATLNGNLQVNGNVQSSGSIADLNAAHGTLGALRNDYDIHTHTVPNVQAGTSTPTTSAPTPTI